MANAKKCDRCGKLYEKYPIDTEDRMFTVDVKEKYNNTDSFRFADMCIECEKKFQSFMKMEIYDDERVYGLTKFGPFINHNDAWKFENDLLSIISDKGYATVEDACYLSGIFPMYRDNGRGWSRGENMLIHTYNLPECFNWWFVSLQPPKPITITSTTCGAKYDCKPGEKNKE